MRTMTGGSDEFSAPLNATISWPMVYLGVEAQAGVLGCCMLEERKQDKHGHRGAIKYSELQVTGPP